MTLKVESVRVPSIGLIGLLKSRIISCQTHLCRRRVVVLFNLSLDVLEGSRLSFTVFV